MSPAIMGAALGFVFGVVNFFLLRNVAKRVAEQKTETSDKSAKVLGIVAWADIVIFAVIGFFIGPMLF